MQVVKVIFEKFLYVSTFISHSNGHFPLLIRKHCIDGQLLRDKMTVLQYINLSLF